MGVKHKAVLLGNGGIIMKYTWTTLLATDNFVDGVIMLNNSLKKVQSKYDLLVMATNNLSQVTFDKLNNENIQYKLVPYLSFFATSSRNLPLWGHNIIDPREGTWWDCTLSKINMFLLTEYDRVCFLDADLEFLENCDHYFEYPTPSGYAFRWTEGMHGSIILIQPNIEDFLKCLSIGLRDGIVNDEMVWWYWNPSFKAQQNHHFPIDDIFLNLENIPRVDNRKILHHDGFDKPWLKKEN
jgi:glycogenin glucosyltransferase